LASPSFNIFVAAVAQKLIGEDHVVSGISVYINNADPKKAANRQPAPGSAMSFQYQGGYSGRGGPAQASGSRYFGGNNNQSFGQPSSTMGQGGSGFNGNVPYNSMNPAVLAAALDTWNTMVNGMFASGAAQGGRPGWQGNNNDMKKDGNPSNWSGKGDFKWS